MALLKQVDIPRRGVIEAFVGSVNERVGDVDLEIRSLPSDIPSIATSYYASLEDAFVILFATRDSHDISVKELSDDVWLYIDPDTTQIVGLGVKGLRKQGAARVLASIRAGLGTYEHDLTQKMEQSWTWSAKLRRAGSLSIERRKLRFFQSELPKALGQLENNSLGRQPDLVGAGAGR